MTRLLVEEGGVRRSFKVGDGVLVIGSGEGAALRLTSADVAEEHAELDVRGERVFLRARPGVVPPRVGGVPITGEQELQPGACIELGAARIQVEFKGRPGAVASPPSAPRAPTATGNPGPAGGVAPIKSKSRANKSRSGGRSTTKRAGRGSRKAPSEPGSLRRSAERRRSRRAPWVTPAILVGVAIGIAIFARVIAPAMFADAAPEFEPLAHFHRANKALKTRRLEDALAELDSLPSDIELDAVMARQMTDLRAVIEQEIVTRDRGRDNDLGDEFLSTQLQSFEREHLQGLPERAAVRVFLTRAAEFERRWPQHDQLDWVHRMQGRYAANSSLSEAPSFEDLEFEIKMLTRADPRDFGAILERIQHFMASCSPSDRSLAAELAEAKTVERQAWFEDKLQQARAAYDNDERGTSVEWLVRIVLYTGDAAMAEEGAQRLVRFADLVASLRGYRRAAPEKFERLIQHPTIRAYLVDHPLD